MEIDREILRSALKVVINYMDGSILQRTPGMDKKVNKWKEVMAALDRGEEIVVK